MTKRGKGLEPWAFRTFAMMVLPMLFACTVGFTRGRAVSAFVRCGSRVPSRPVGRGHSNVTPLLPSRLLLSHSSKVSSFLPLFSQPRALAGAGNGKNRKGQAARTGSTSSYGRKVYGTTKRMAKNPTAERKTHSNGNEGLRNMPGTTTKSLPNKLLEPSVLFQNNHVLIVNKPAGWHSVPNDHTTSNTSKDFKCLLEKLKRMKLGGGSQNDFLLPMHRIDQPCTGALVFAKNKKAGTRITTAWKKGEVTKEYWCVVQGQLSQMQARSQFTEHKKKRSSSYGYAVEGILKRVASPNSRSVVVSPLAQHLQGQPSEKIQVRRGERLCHLEWDHVCHVKGTPFELIRVKTKTGARHQVRAMLAQLLQCAIAGDLRYGTSSMKALSDQSVALHARSLFLPTVKLGGMEQLATEHFVSPIPPTWRDLFGLDEKQFRSRRAS